MKTPLYLLLLSALLFSCKKGKDNSNDNKQFTVEGLTDFAMMQGFDTVVIPITVKSTSGSSEPLLLSVTNLPDNLIADIEMVDSVNGKYNIRFVTYYATTETSIELGLKVGEIIPAGIIHPRLVVSTPNKAEQSDFKINITRHPVLAIAGDYYQSFVYPGIDTVVNHKMKVVIESVWDSTSGLMAFRDIILSGKTADMRFIYLSTSSREFFSSGIIDTVFRVQYGVMGTYSDTMMTFTAPSLFTCDVMLKRL